jgi:hypothetical protein
MISWAVAVPLMTLLEPHVQNPIRIAYADISVEDHTSQRVGRQGFAVGGVFHQDLALAQDYELDYRSR